MKAVVLLVAPLVLVLSSCSRKEAASEPAPVAPAAAPGAAAGEETRRELPASTRQPVDSMDLAASEKALAEASRQLEESLALAAPDCPTAEVLRDRICDLSAHICRLVAAEHAPADPEMEARCKDAGRRCERAKERVASMCR